MVDDLRAALDRVLTGDAEQHLGAVVRDALRPVIEQAFRAGFRAGVETTRGAAERAIEAALRSGEQALRAAVVRTTESETNTDSRQRRSPRRAAHGSLRPLVEQVLTERPGLRIAEAQRAAQAIDSTISALSVGNEIRRHAGTRYRRDGARWFLIGDTETRTGEAGSSASEPDLWVGRPGQAAA